MKSSKKGTLTLNELSAQVTAALELLDTETADELIGERSPDYDTLVQGGNALMAMDWAVKKSQGLRENKKTLKRGAQTMAMVLTLIHYAYALGIKRGQGG